MKGGTLVDRRLGQGQAEEGREGMEEEKAHDDSLRRCVLMNPRNLNQTPSEN